MHIHPVDFYPDQQFRVDPTACFVIMPFGEAWSQRVYELVKASVESVGYHCRRGDDDFGRVVLVDVWKRLNEASFVVADLTSDNPNVYYELGVAHTLGKEIIPIIQRGGRIPFDQQPFRILMYEDTVDGRGNLGRDLPRWIDSLDHSSSPQAMLLRGLVSTFNESRSTRRNVDLTNADFSGLDLTEVNLDGAIMRGAFLERTGLNGARLSAAVLTSCRLALASLIGARGQATHLSEADLTGADLTDCFLVDAVMIRTNFTDVVARRAVLKGSNLSESSLINADFSDADLRDGIWVRTRLDGATLNGAAVAGMTVDRATYLRYRRVFDSAVDADQVIVED